jgi:hypothetical protein
MKDVLVVGLVLYGFASATANGKDEVKIAGKPAYRLAVAGLELRLSDRGEVVGAVVAGKGPGYDVCAHTELAGCRVDGDVRYRKLEGGGVEFTKTLLQVSQNRRCRLVERFLPMADSVRWELEITSDGAAWTTPVITELRWPVTGDSRFWTAWMRGAGPNEDPLEVQPWQTAQWGYGPFYATGICLPLASFLDSGRDAGLSAVLSPEDTILDMTLVTEPDGTTRFQRFNHRLGRDKTLRFSLDLVAHEADWRGGLRWMAKRYQPFFDSPNPAAAGMAGCGAYPEQWSLPADVDRLNRISFRLFCAASYDYPYYGMWLPPVDDTETWKSWRSSPPVQVSITQLRDRARRVREAGFYYLNYFNCSEFGTFDAKVNFDWSAASTLPERELWKDGAAFLRRKLSDSLFRDAAGKASTGGWAPRGVSFVMDPAGHGWQEFLLEQARRHNERIPDAVGIYMDRMWWAAPTITAVKPVNYGADDGVGWYEGRPGRHFSVSFRSFLAKLGPLMHAAGKIILYNPYMAYRLDCYRHVDGFFDEAYGKLAVNGTGLLALRKPAVIWTSSADDLKPDPDAFFQGHLYMGVYPTAPFPTNDHSINPSPAAEKYYLDYGPLLDALRGKAWVLQPHCVEVLDGKAKANLFAVPAGYAAPVVYGGGNASVLLKLRGISGLSAKTRCEVLLPGTRQPQEVRAVFSRRELLVTVPLSRGCAMVQIATAAKQ